jgi:hypothetical protein
MVPVGIFLEVLSTNKSLVLTKFGQDDNLDLNLVRSEWGTKFMAYRSTAVVLN